MLGWRTLRLLVPAVILVALVVDVSLGRSDSASTDLVVDEVLNEVAVPPAEILTSTWFCPMVHLREPVTSQDGSSQDGSSQDSTEQVVIAAEILITNITDRAVQVLMDLNSTRDRESLSLVVGPNETRSVFPADVEVEPGELMSAVVEVTGGGVAVTRRLVSPWGVDQARCSNTVSPQWEIPLGDTQADARDLVIIHNPLPRYAVADISLATEAETGAFNPPELQGVVIPGRATKVVDIADFARRRTVVSASVLVRTGRAAVDHLTIYDGSVGRVGFSVELAVSAISDVWWLPFPGIDDNSYATIRVSNPTSDLAEVEISAMSDIRPESLTESETEQSSESGPELVTDLVSVVVFPNDVSEVMLVANTTDEPDQDTLLVEPGMPIAIKVKSLNKTPVAVAVELLIGDPAEPSAPGDLVERAGDDAGDDALADAFANDLDSDLDSDLANDLDSDFLDALDGDLDSDSDGDPTTEDPATEDTAVEEPAIEDSAIEEPAIEDPVTDDLVTDDPDTEEFEEFKEPVVPVPVIYSATTGLAAVPGHTTPRTRWLLVIPPEIDRPDFGQPDADTETYLTLMAGSPDTTPQTTTPPIETVVAIRRLDGTQVDTISLSASGVVTHRLPGGEVRLLVSEMPFVPVVYLATSQGHGLSGIVALPY